MFKISAEMMSDRIRPIMEGEDLDEMLVELTHEFHNTWHGDLDTGEEVEPSDVYRYTVTKDGEWFGELEYNYESKQMVIA